MPPLLHTSREYSRQSNSALRGIFDYHTKYGIHALDPKRRLSPVWKDVLRGKLNLLRIQNASDLFF
jgi:hypothetical protein